MDFIEPLSLQTWFVSILSGSQDIFLSLALFVIFGMAAYFRMNLLVMMFMLTAFLIIFNAYISNYILLIVAILGGIVLGIVIARIVKN